MKPKEQRETEWSKKIRGGYIQRPRAELFSGSPLTSTWFLAPFDPTNQGEKKEKDRNRDGEKHGWGGRVYRRKRETNFGVKEWGG